MLRPLVAATLVLVVSAVSPSAFDVACGGHHEGADNHADEMLFCKNSQCNAYDVAPETYQCKHFEYGVWAAERCESCLGSYLRTSIKWWISQCMGAWLSKECRRCTKENVLSIQPCTMTTAHRKLSSNYCWHPFQRH